MNRIPALLSKTKLLRGYRCLKSIYLTIHQPTLEAPITPETQALFDQGNAVGEEARNYFPGGVLVDCVPWDFSGALAKTRHLIASGAHIIYEAAFEYMGCYARADIIQFSPATQRWRIIEVKSTTKVKPEHIDDVGLQTWIITKSGLPVEQINIMHLNSACRYPDLSDLFTIQDITNELRANYLTVQPKLAEIFNAIRQPAIPDISIGSYCREPNECGFIKHCWKNIPAMSIFNLPGMRGHEWALFQNGIVSLDDPRLTNLNELQTRMVNAYKSNERFIDRAAIQQDLLSWQFPLYFLDFETINPAIPRYDDCGPFQQVPFQFSVHYWSDKNADITHIEFLHDTPDDPRPTLIEALLKACGETGPIVAYYGQFEATRIAELANFSPAHSEALRTLIDRIVDPLPIIRHHLYDNAFKGSFSLKNVAPALLGQSFSYDDMPIKNGGEAQRGFEALISPHTPPAKKAAIRDAMLDYCKKDTWVMVLLAQWLFEQTV